MNSRYNRILKELRTGKGLKQSTVTEKLNAMGIKTTQGQVSRWENGYNNPDIEQFTGLCGIYGVKDVFSVFHNGKTENTDELNEEGMRLLEEYRKLLIASGMYGVRRKHEARILRFSAKTVPLYDIAVSAGTGQYTGESDYEMTPVPEKYAGRADFAVRISGDSMEPDFHDGQTVYVHSRQDISPGDVGVFLLNGNSYIKEFMPGENGCLLISRNPEYESISVDMMDDFRICGTVLTD